MTYPRYTYSEELYSDFHKEAYGFRPGESTMTTWNSMTPDEKQQEWDNLTRISEENMAESAARKVEAVAEFEDKIRNKMAGGAADRKEAIRGILQDIDVKGDSPYTAGYACYLLDLPFEMENEIVEAYS